MSKIITNNITPRSGGNIDVTGKLSVSGNVSVGGTLTYEDVTNIDSVGLITARSGIKVNAGGINVAGGGANIIGVVTATSFSGDGSALTGVSVPEGTNVLKAMLFS